MQDNSIFNKYPELIEFIRILRYEVQQAQRPANEIILDDEAVMAMLKICKRKLQTLISEKKIPTHKFDPDSPRRYYLLSDLLDILRKNRIEAVTPKF